MLDDVLVRPGRDDLRRGADHGPALGLEATAPQLSAQRHRLLQRATRRNRPRSRTRPVAGKRRQDGASRDRKDRSTPSFGRCALKQRQLFKGSRESVGKLLGRNFRLPLSSSSSPKVSHNSLAACLTSRSTCSNSRISAEFMPWPIITAMTALAAILWILSSSERRR